MILLERYRYGQAYKEDLIAKSRDLLDQYPNDCVQNSILLKGDGHDTLAWGLDLLISDRSSWENTVSVVLCVAIVGKKREIVDYVLIHSPIISSAYHHLIMEEMSRRGYKVSPEWLDKNYRDKTCPAYEDLTEETLTSPIYKEHDVTYYEECLANLREIGIDL